MTAVRASCFSTFFLLLALAISLTAATAQGDPAVLLGGRSGVNAPTALELSPGPLVGADVTLRLKSLWAVEFVLEHGWHGPVSLTQGALGLQYRIDVTLVVPYLTLAAEAQRLARRGRPPVFGYGGALAGGVLVPFGERWFWGAEARYGISLQGEFPVRQTFLLRIGWRSHGI
ncbi:MAG: hypothetical protein WBV82_25530 [Myxococcaceae bacterium]